MGVIILRNASSGFDLSDTMFSQDETNPADSTAMVCSVPGTTQEGVGLGKFRAASDLPEKLATIADGG